MQTTLRALGALVLAAVVGCGGAKSGGTAARSGGTIEGTVGGTSSQSLRVAVPDGPSTTTDASGAFLLEGIPAGAATLRFTGAGVDATLAIAAVLAGEYRQVSFSVSGASATERCERTGTEFNGPIEEIDGANATITVAGRTVAVTDATAIRNGRETATFTDLQVGQLVDVHGTLQADGTVTALLVVIRPDPGPGEAPGAFVLVGTLTAVDGTNLTVAGQAVDASAARIVKGDQDLTVADLKVGDRLLVRGVPQNGMLLAGLVRVLERPGEPDDLHVVGKVSAVDVGASTFTVGDTKVSVDASTTWEGHGTPSLATLAVGDLVFAEVTKLADGSLLATEVHVVPAPAPLPGDLVPVHGAVTEVGTDGLTLAVRAGPTSPTSQVKLLVTASTRIMRGTTEIALADVRVGELATALAQRAADGTLTALTILVAPAVPMPVLDVHGPIGTVDAAARTVVVGDQTLHVDDATLIMQGTKPIGLADLVTGEPAAAAAVQAPDGTLLATFVWVMPMRS